MKILVIMTGGTIGSKIENNIIDVKQDSYHILEKYKQIYDDAIQFDTIQPLNILSENFTINTLENLANVILSQNVSNYDGIIITHGSDTLCYTSSFLGMITRHFTIPIVIVASNYELSNSMANGLHNFHGAVQLIRSKMVRGCFVVWEDSISKKVNIHIGTRLRECDSFTDNFQSFGGQPFAEIINGDIVLNESEINPSLKEINQNRKPICNNIKLNGKCVLIKTYTGLDYSNIKLNNDVSSIVIYLYHSGTACTIHGSYSILDFINDNLNRKIYISSLKRTKDVYSTGNQILSDAKVTPMYNISIESSYIKALILSNIETCIMENIFFEEI